MVFLWKNAYLVGGGSVNHSQRDDGDGEYYSNVLQTQLDERVEEQVVNVVHDVLSG